MENNGNEPLEPVTAMIVRTVRPGKGDEFEAWVEVMRPVVMKFPGFLGTDVIRPRGSANSEYVIVVRFDNYDHLRVFMESAERAEIIKLSEPLTMGEPSIQEAHGFTSFFSLPGQPSAAVVPAKYKMAILTLLALYVPLAGHQHSRSHDLPRPAAPLAGAGQSGPYGPPHDLDHHAVGDKIVSSVAFPAVEIIILFNAWL